MIPSMFTVGRLHSRWSACSQSTSWIHRVAPRSSLAFASLIRFAARWTIWISAEEMGRAASAKPSMAGSAPSAVTSEASACTRWNGGLSSRARFAECTSLDGPRPQRAPLTTSSSSMTPLAPKLMVTSPSGSCEALGMKMPIDLARAAAMSGRRTTSPKCGEPISSSPSATRTRFTGSFRLPVR